MDFLYNIKEYLIMKRVFNEVDIKQMVCLLLPASCDTVFLNKRINEADASPSDDKLGGLAQLARALAWHARGHRFDPDILHTSLPYIYYEVMRKRSLTY